jgi:hypothetical protein
MQQRNIQIFNTFPEFDCEQAVGRWQVTDRLIQDADSNLSEFVLDLDLKASPLITDVVIVKYQFLIRQSQKVLLVSPMMHGKDIRHPVETSIEAYCTVPDE